ARVPTPVSAPRGSTAHADGQSVPERLRGDPGLRNFPGTVLVPPSDLAPFKDLPILRLDATGQGIARYAVYYGDLTTGVASVSGQLGSSNADTAVAAARRVGELAAHLVRLP